MGLCAFGRWRAPSIIFVVVGRDVLFGEELSKEQVAAKPAMQLAWAACRQGRRAEALTDGRDSAAAQSRR